MEDAGRYNCKAINGFGSININYTLIIVGKWNIVIQGKNQSQI